MFSNKLLRASILAVFTLLLASWANATIFGSVRGLIHDPQHRPVPGAQVKISATTSSWEKIVTTDSAGEFAADSVPLGEYKVQVELAGFSPEAQTLTLTSGRDARLHFSLQLASATETVEVRDVPLSVNPESSTTADVISRRDIAETPGADQSNSLAMIANYRIGAVGNQPPLCVVVGLEMPGLAARRHQKDFTALETPDLWLEVRDRLIAFGFKECLEIFRWDFGVRQRDAADRLTVAANERPVANHLVHRSGERTGLGEILQDVNSLILPSAFENSALDFGEIDHRLPGRGPQAHNIEARDSPGCNVLRKR